MVVKQKNIAHPMIASPAAGRVLKAHGVDAVIATGIGDERCGVAGGCR